MPFPLAALAPTAPLSASVTAAVTEAEKSAVRAAAKAAGLSVSAWVRKAVTARLAKGF